MSRASRFLTDPATLDVEPSYGHPQPPVPRWRTLLLAPYAGPIERRRLFERELT